MFFYFHRIYNNNRTIHIYEGSADFFWNIIDIWSKESVIVIVKKILGGEESKFIIRDYASPEEAEAFLKNL